MKRMLVAVLMFALPLLAFARDAVPHTVIRDIPGFVAHQMALREDLDAPKFQHVAAADKERLTAAQDRMLPLLERVRSTDELTDDERVVVYNAQSEIAGILADAELDRPICERAELAGSHFRQTVCLSKRERQKLRDQARAVWLDTRSCVNCAIGQ